MARFDQIYATSYGLAGRFRGEGAGPTWIISAPTISELADKLGVPVDNFTPARY